MTAIPEAQVTAWYKKAFLCTFLKYKYKHSKPNIQVKYCRAIKLQREDCTKEFFTVL